MTNRDGDQEVHAFCELISFGIALAGRLQVLCRWLEELDHKP